MSKLTPKQCSILHEVQEKHLPYYVYELIDPRNMKTFYVGKGKGKRVSEHTNKVKRNSSYQSNKAKVDTIRDILSCGMEPIEKIIERFETDEEAVEHEEYVISLYGIDNLTNIQRKGAVHIPYSHENKGLAEAKKAIRHAARMLATICNPNKHISKYPTEVDGEIIDAKWIFNSLVGIYEEIVNGKFRKQVLEVLDHEIETKHFGASRLAW